MSFVVAKVVRSGVVFVVEMWLWLALWRRWLVVGVLEKVEGGWRCGDVGEEMMLSFVMAKVVRCWRLWRRW